jgi:hypothetical protein
VQNLMKLSALESAYAIYTAYAQAAFQTAATHLGKTWYMSQSKYDVINAIQSLPRDVAGLRPNAEQMAKWSKALAKYAEGADIALNNATFAVELAEEIHAALQVAMTVGGVSGIVATGAQVLVNQGCAAFAKYGQQLIVNAAAGTAISLASKQAVALVSKWTGISEEWVRIGADAIQLGFFVRAARAERLKRGAGCFVAGTEVMTQYGPVAIEELRVGQRVLTDVSASGPGAPPAVSGEPDQTAVHPATWRVVSLRMPDDRHPGSYYEMELLQPMGWIARNNAAAGRWVDLSLPELQISGMAQVTGIGQCPPIESGYGRVVLGTFTSVSSDVYELKLAGQDEAIGVTSGHPIWSLDRGDWIAAGALRPGERLATAAGEAVVEDVTAQPGEQRVYNLNVEGDHRYLVTTLGLLVHNAGPCGGNFQKLTEHALKKNGVSAHALKEAYVGNQGSHWDIALDKASQKLYLVPHRTGAADNMPLDITLADAQALYPL